ncbi:hypothetical protein JXB02_05120 [Candidatus Woesearchaeota archaeon]|nr:hypothetical protein [Candidatus Woesearchaeota archaeon]
MANVPAIILVVGGLILILVAACMALYIHALRLILRKGLGEAYVILWAIGWIVPPLAVLIIAFVMEGKAPAGKRGKAKRR